jgi:hypothetical protein
VIVVLRGCQPVCQIRAGETHAVLNTSAFFNRDGSASGASFRGLFLHLGLCGSACVRFRTPQNETVEAKYHPPIGGVRWLLKTTLPYVTFTELLRLQYSRSLTMRFYVLFMKTKFSSYSHSGPIRPRRQTLNDDCSSIILSSSLPGR